MPVYRYQVMLLRGEEFVEEGTVIANDETHAKQKLKPLKYRQVKLKKLTGLNAFFKHFNADIR